ncbi:M56 family metallopeptidase [Luteolibacter sp. Populi]|uniref:M56 family metallopeptidase n=1 Tax=Luteolibacter sp. Populi TaxID=3230487 RepID=UPI0034678C7D
MNTLESMFDWLLATTLRASVLALAILALQLLLRRWLPPQWRHSLWMPLLLVLALPVLPAVPFGLFPTKAEANATAAPVAPASALEFGTAAAAEPPVAATPRTNLPGVNPLAVLWLSGTVAVLAIGLASYRRNMRRVIKGAVRVDDSLRISLTAAAREVGLRRKPLVIVSTNVDSPAVTGLVRPSLLLPAGFPAGFNEAEARMILLHEFTHLKRLDLPVNWLTCVFQAMHWFNPILWFAFARMRADRESACDAQVLSLNHDDRRSDYGHALLKLQSATPQLGLNLGFVGIFERNAELKTRIREISAHRKAHPAWRAGGVAMIGTLTIFGATKAEEPEKKEAPAVPRVIVNQPPVNPGTAYIMAKLNKIVIPLINFEDASLEEAIDFVRLRSKELDTAEKDPAKKGVNFVIRKPRPGVAGTPDPGAAKLSLELKNATMLKVLSEIAGKTGTRFKIDEFAVTFVPADEQDNFVVGPLPAPPKFEGKAAEAGSKIIIPIVDFEDTSLKEAVDFLNLRARELSKGEPVFPVVLDPKADGATRIKELRLRNVPLVVALKYVAESTKTVITANDSEIRITKP